MADVKWIKIVTDIFDDEKILLIESLPEGDSIIVIWFKLLCLAGKQNNSGVFIMANAIPYTDKMLATIFRRKESTVQLALKTFERFGMIEIIDGVITIPNWDKHQTLDSYEKKKQRDRIYRAERRAAQKALTEKLVNESSDSRPTVARQLHDKSSGVAVSDKEGEEDKDKDIYIAVVDCLNSVCKTCYRASSKATQRLIKARLNDGFVLDDFKQVINKKAAEWGKDPKMCKFLRPETLFGTKFESYLNQKDKDCSNEPSELDSVF